MSFKYKTSGRAILEALKSSGYSSHRLREEKLIGENAIQALRNNEIVSLKTLDAICKLLQCQPGDILEYVPEAPENITE